MTDRPIIFSAPMIAALLDGRKTMTRRLAWSERKPAQHNRIQYSRRWDGSTIWQRVKPGDRLWCREAFWIVELEDGGIGVPYLVYDEEWSSGPGAKMPQPTEIRDGDGLGKWGHHPSIHMPRRASRLTLIVTATKTERLREITLNDAKDEGIEEYPEEMRWWPLSEPEHVTTNRTTVENFAALWRYLHGPGSWEANPEVVAITFRVVKANIDRMAT